MLEIAPRTRFVTEFSILVLEMHTPGAESGVELLMISFKLDYFGSCGKEEEVPSPA